MVNMVIFDAVHHPQPGQHKTLGKEGIEYLAKINYDSFTEEELNTARNLLEKEQEIVEEENQFYDDELENAIFEKIWNNAFGNVVFAPHEKKYLEKQNLERNQKVEAAKKEYENLLNTMRKETKKVVNLERKLQVYHAGYSKRAEELQVKIAKELYEEFVQRKIEKECFANLRLSEIAATQSRIAKLSQEVEDQRNRENELQRRYANLIVQQT